MKQKSKPKSILISRSQNGSEIEDRNFAKVGVGGFYSFYENGQLKSYSFLVKTDTSYDKLDPNIEVLGGDTTTGTTSYCSYAELYDTTGKVIKVLGSPLTYRMIKRLTTDSLFVSLYFSSLNKHYSNVIVDTNTGDEFNLDLLNDSLFTNMKKASFIYNFKESDEIRIYIGGEYFSDCSKSKQNLNDTIFLKYEKGAKLKNGM